MTPRITTTGRDSFTPPAAMAPARRMHVHGPVQSADDRHPDSRIGRYALMLFAGFVLVGLLSAGVA